MTQSPDSNSMSNFPDDLGGNINLFAIAATFWRGKWIIAAFLILGMIAGGFYGYRIAVPLYRATATISFLPSREQNFSGADSVVSGLQGDLVTMNTEIAVMRSRKLIGKLVEELNLTNLPEFNPWLRKINPYTVRNFPKLLLGTLEQPEIPEREILLRTATKIAIGKISVVNSRSSLVLLISATTENGPLSASMVNKLAEIYILDQIETKFAATEQATSWLSDRVTELKSELEESETQVKEFDAGAKLVSAASLGGLRIQLKESRDRLEETQALRAPLLSRVETLESAKNEGDFLRMSNVASDRILDRVVSTVDLDTDEGQLAYIARFDQILNRAKLDLRRVSEKGDLIEASLNELSAEISRQSEDLVVLQQLQREADASKLIYEFFLGRLKEASAQQGINQADSRILSEAVPGGYFAPRKNRIIVMTGLMGILISAAFLLMRELMQTAFRTSEELEAATGLTVMGSIPKVTAKHRGDVLKYVLAKPNSALAESVRNLRTSIMLSNVDKPPQVLMVTSSLPGEGKTTQSLVLAQNISTLGKKVLLIEGDVRRRVFNQYFNIRENANLVAVITGEAQLEESVQHVDEIGADVLAGEKTKVNAADLFASKSFEKFLNQARAQYDFIIIDTPPVLVVPDARVIANFVDAILYSVHWDKTSRTQVKQGLHMLETVGLKVTGLSMTQVDPKGMKSYGYGNYGAYSAYSAGYYDN
jgi:polysaccharide biosynthesis transport protein